MCPNWFLGRPVLSAICEQLFPNVTERTARDVLLMWSAYKLKQRQSTWEWRPSWNSIQTFYFGFDFRNSSRDILTLSASCCWHILTALWPHTQSRGRTRSFNPQRTPPMTSTWCQVCRTWLVFSQASTSWCQWVTLTEAVRDSLHLSLSQSFALESLINSSLDDE